MSDQVIEKFTPPTRYDHASFGTLYKNMQDESLSEYYIQLSKDANDPNWERLGLFIVKLFEEFVTHPDFVSSLIAIYNKDENSFFKLVDFIKTIKSL